MSLRHHLRQYQDTRTHLERQCENISGATITKPLANKRYLYLFLTNPELGEAEAILDLDDWLEKTDVSLPSMPWHDVPFSYLMRWLNEMHIRFVVQNSVWEVQYFVAVNYALPEQLLLIPAQPCPLMCVDWPENSAIHKVRKDAILSAITFDLNCVLGNSTLPLNMLVDIAVGDLLIIKQYQPRLKIGHRDLFNVIYDYNQEIIVDQPLQDESQNIRDEDEALFQWTQLPVNIEFVLDSQTVTLADLDTLTVGSILSISPGAEQKIKIYINRKLLASGELVALSDGKLAVEINQLSQHVNTVTGSADAQ